VKRLTFTLVLAVAVSACGSGGADTSDPVAACKSVFTTLCNKLFQCNASGAAQIYGSASACASNLSTGCNANNTSCPAGRSYNAGNASTCINDYNNESCSDIATGTTPQSCNSVCQ
jgi:hypothetical protein